MTGPSMGIGRNSEYCQIITTCYKLKSTNSQLPSCSWLGNFRHDPYDIDPLCFIIYVVHNPHLAGNCSMTRRNCLDVMWFMVWTWRYIWKEPNQCHLFICIVALYRQNGLDIVIVKCIYSSGWAEQFVDVMLQLVFYSGAKHCANNSVWTNALSLLSERFHEFEAPSGKVWLPGKWPYTIVKNILS